MYQSEETKQILNCLGDMIHCVDEALKSGDPSAENYVFNQVMRNCYEQAYLKLDYILNRNMKLPNTPDAYAETTPQTLELTISQLQNILNKAIRTNGDTVVLCDDGGSFQALCRRYKDDSCRQIYTSESLQ